MSDEGWGSTDGLATASGRRAQSARLVVLHRLWHPPLDLGDARGFGRMRREELGGSTGGLAREVSHAHPKIADGVRVVASLGHEDQPQVVGLGFLGARPHGSSTPTEAPVPRRALTLCTTAGLPEDKPASVSTTALTPICWLMRSPPCRATTWPISWPSTTASPVSSLVTGRPV